MAKNNLIILGIHTHHESGASIVKNGEVLAAINEDRIRNIKHYEDYPTKSIEEVFRISKVNPSEIDAIAITNVAEPRFKKKFSPHTEYLDIITHWDWVSKSTNGLNQLSFYHRKFNKIHDMKKLLSKIGVPLKQIIFVEHHLAHAASAYYLSPWNLDDDVLILTADGQGDGISSTISTGKKGKINRITDSETNSRDSLGELYSVISGFLGMHYGYHAGKVMGLAPYGSPKYVDKIYEHLVDVKPDGSFRLNMNYFQFTYSDVMVGKPFEELFGTTVRAPESNLDKIHMDIANSIQVVLQEILVKISNHAYTVVESPNLCIAGGVALNCVANSKILNQTPLLKPLKASCASESPIFRSYQVPH